MAKSVQRQLGFLKEDFLRASSTWPGLHHAFIQLDMGVDIGGMGELNFFLETWPKTVVAPITEKRVILESSVSLHDTLASGLRYATQGFAPPAADRECGACRTNIGSGIIDGGRSSRTSLEGVGVPRPEPTYDRKHQQSPENVLVKFMHRDRLVGINRVRVQAHMPTTIDCNFDLAFASFELAR